MMARILGLVLVLLVLGAVDVWSQELSPCVAITGADSTRAEKCIPVPVDTVPTPPDTVVTPPSDTAVWARAMGLWKPTRPGDCTQAQHDAYSAIGPDGKRYPVWHPPVGEDGCHFGHEHGDDPATSAIADAPPTLFGYVNEQALDGPNYHRHEDHVGHKVFVVNAATFAPTAAAESKAPLGPVSCHVIAKLHQGTHSPDAFTNNLHEQTTSVRCANGWAFDVQLLSAIGKAGTVTARCPERVVATGAYVPPDSPTSSPQNPGGSMGHRFLPSVECVEVLRPSFFENWKTQNPIIGPNGKNAVRFAWYWSVSDPSRYWSATGLRRTLDQCFRQVGGVYQTINNPCLGLRSGWDGVPIPWDSEASIFKGAQRGLRLNDFQISNADGATVFYTDVLGLNGSLVPFPGSVRQFVSNGFYPYPLGGGENSVSRDFNATGVRAPN